MLLGATELRGYAISATDGEIGKVSEFLFDDRSWAIRYLVVDTGGWLTGRLVLIPPHALGHPDRENKALPVSLTRQQVEDSPGIAEDRPVTRQYEAEYYDYFGWPHYWAQPYAWGGEEAYPVRGAGDSQPLDTRGQGEDADPHLESTSDLGGCRISALDGEIGHLDDFVLDDEDWEIRYVVVATRDWLPGKKVLIAREWVREVRWRERTLEVGLAKDAIEGAPVFDTHAPIDAQYLERLHTYYEQADSRA